MRRLPFVLTTLALRRRSLRSVLAQDDWAGPLASADRLRPGRGGATPRRRRQLRAPASHGVDHRQSMWRFELGYRGSFVPDAGYDPFSTNDSLPQVSLTASRTLFTRGIFSFAPGISWDYGNSGAFAGARRHGVADVRRRLTVPLEGRVHFGTAASWGYAFLRGRAGRRRTQSAELDDASAPAAMTKSAWLFATDVSAGYAWLAFPRANPSSKAPRLWLQADGGYGWVVSDRLRLSPQLPAGSQAASGVDLGSVSMSGGFFRFGAAMSF